MARIQPFLISTLAFVLAIAIGGALVNFAEQSQREKQRQTIKDIGTAQAHILENHLNQSLSATFALASILRQGESINNFDTLAAEMIRNYGGISSLQLAPNGVVTQIYPMAGNEAAIGHDLLNDPRRRTEALAAIESRRLTLAGPVTLVQGGMGVIGRLPVFVPDDLGEERFWGFTIALIRLPDLLKASNLNHLVERGYSYNISRFYPDGGAKFVFAWSDEGILKNAISVPVKVPNGRWILAIAPRGGWQTSSSLPWEIALLLLVSMLISVVTYAFTRRREVLYQEVECRTRELSEANRALEGQMVERQRSEYRFRRLLESTPDPTIISRQDGTIAFANQQTETAFGYSQDELIGKTIELLVPQRYHPQHVQYRTDYFTHPRTRHMGKGMELYARRKDGSEFPVEISLSAIETEAGVLAASSIRDITERKRMGESLQEAHDQLEIRVQQRTMELSKANASLTREIRQREQIEATLLESEGRSYEQLAELELLYKTAPLGLCHMDRDLRFWRCNDKLAEINGIPAEDHIGRTLREIVPEIAETMESVYHHVIESGEPVIDVVATGATAADRQKIRHFSACYYPVKSEDGVVQGVSSIVQDITERKEAEENLREAHNQLERRIEERTKQLAETNLELGNEIIERKQIEETLRGSEERLRILLESTSAVPWEADAETWLFTYVGPQAPRLLGYPIEQWYGKDFWPSHIYPEDRESAIRTCLESSRQNQDFEFEYRMVSSDGRTVWIQDIVNVESTDGIPKTLRGFMIDITARKRAEALVRERDERFRRLLEATPDPTIITRHDGTIAFVNQQAEIAFGYAREELLGKTVEILVPERVHVQHVQHRMDYFTHPRTRPMGNGLELYCRRKDGSEFPVEISLSAIETEEGMLAASSLRDITERKRTENTLQDLRARMINAQEEARSRLARELHDDISQRLAVLGIEAGKLEQMPQLSELARERLQGMKKQIIKLSVDIHSLSRQLHPSILDDLGLVDAIGSECTRFSELEGVPVKFTADILEELPLPNDVSLCLYRIIQESLRNIANHSRAKEASVILTRKEGSVLLSIQDSGIGFDPEKVKGKPGLGLASMEERVTLINGSLSVHSHPGHGTIIEVRVSLARTQNEPMVTPKQVNFKTKTSNFTS